MFDGQMPSGLREGFDNDRIIVYWWDRKIGVAIIMWSGRRLFL